MLGVREGKIRVFMALALKLERKLITNFMIRHYLSSSPKRRLSNFFSYWKQLLSSRIISH